MPSISCAMCGNRTLIPTWKDNDGFQWYNCLDCGSQTSEAVSDPKLYLDFSTLHTQSREERIKSFEIPANWFEHYRHEVPSFDFIDVGYGDDCMMEQMRNRGWSVHGFDVANHLGAHTTNYPFFTTSVFSRKFGAVFSSHAIEHTDYPFRFLVELKDLLLPRGLLQLRCPRTQGKFNPAIHQGYHTCVPSMSSIELGLLALGFRVLDRRNDANQQEWLCKRGDFF